ncbi:MAG TPA: hypothetical protein VGR28_02080 [Candidatus Thermoplasmatota archaeon]|jgi:lysophospholipase L1-like esterase|nr:hypothetical protein [Candidatus Thermoplasmatota archaeon]
MAVRAATPMRTAILATLALLLPATVVVAPPALAIDCTGTSTGLVPLTDLGQGSYQGFEGGLYPGGGNERPATHTLLGEALATLAMPRDLAGNPDPLLGKLVFLSIGMSNTRNEFTTFVPLSNADPDRHPQVVAFNGAIGGQDARRIADPQSAYWQQVLTMLVGAGLSPLQVQAVWLKEAIAGPTAGFPAATEELRDLLRQIVQDIQLYFPNAHLVYMASRIYAGYATTSLNPEAYAYESGFAVKWLIEEQLASPATFVTLQEPTSGVLLPWLSWGPYLWADGTTPRGDDGLVWLCSDFNSDGTHPNGQGSRKVADLLMDFVHTDSTAKIWYEHAGTDPV